jgi:ribonuclease HII
MQRQEEIRLSALMQFEEQAKAQGFQRIAGVDEAGRGPLAGPVVAAACVLPESARIEGIDDSKRLTMEQRCRLFQEIISLPGVDYGLGIMDVMIIDQINILQATWLAMLAAVSRLSSPPDYILVDGPRLPPSPPCLGKAIIKGDRLSQSIAAASILAKQTRDQFMILASEQWPQYGFHAHMGYGTLRHLEALAQYGPCALHRLSFAPVQRARRL